MKVYVNTLVKNEATLLKHVLPYWARYPVDKFMFWDDGSTDNTTDVIMDKIGDRAEIHYTDSHFNESSHRNFLAGTSKDEGADLIISLDCDELLGYSFVLNFDQVCKEALRYNLGTYQCNVVNNSLSFMRQDPAYINNFRFFLIPTARMGSLATSEFGIHRSEREPFIDLQKVISKEICFIHLQAMNRKFYAMKQVYYKVDQMLNPNNDTTKIIKNIDEACNNLQFNEILTPVEYIGGWNFDSSVFDKILEERKYEKIIRDYLDKTGRTDICSQVMEYLK